MIKKVGKAILCGFLESQVRRLRQQHEFTIVAVAGSVGKTSSKLAIARLLGSKQRVLYQDGNYNDRLTVPLVLFGHTEPGIFNIKAWLGILRANNRIIAGEFPYDVVVLELGTDGIGQMAKFAYLRPEIVVTTAVADEHMEYFKTLDAVAKEELVTLKYAQTSLLNIDDIPHKYLPQTAFSRYGFDTTADYRITEQHSRDLTGQQLTLQLKKADSVNLHVKPLGRQGAKIALAAAAVADLLGWSAADITEGVKAITPVPGRMQILPGIERSTLIDDTYNSSPVAVRAALDVLYDAKATQRIAILGTMNELGETSQAAHELVGSFCDPARLDLVVTIGQQAQTYLAPIAEKSGCKVASFDSPYEAGAYVQHELQRGAVVLAKGSQNGVFSEEALKPLLENPSDAEKLVRQSEYWLGVKGKQFPQAT